MGQSSATFSGEEWERLLGQVGYGNPGGPIWFLGMEESLGSTDPEANLRWRLNSFEQPFATFAVFGPRPDGGKTPTWPMMAKLVRLVHERTSDWSDRWQAKEYVATKLGRADADTCLLELLPLPKDNVRHFPSLYHERFPQGLTQYRNEMLPKRVALLRGLADEYQPHIVFCYGKAFWSYYKLAFEPLHAIRSEKYDVKAQTGIKPRETVVEIGRWHESTIVFMPFFTPYWLPHRVLEAVAALL